MVVLYHSSQMYTRASGSSVGGLRLRSRDHRVKCVLSPHCLRDRFTVQPDRLSVPRFLRITRQSLHNICTTVLYHFLIPTLFPTPLFQRRRSKLSLTCLRAAASQVVTRLGSESKVYSIRPLQFIPEWYDHAMCRICVLFHDCDKYCPLFFHQMVPCASEERST